MKKVGRKQVGRKQVGRKLGARLISRSECGAPIITPIFLEGGPFCLVAAIALEEDGSGDDNDCP